MKPLTPLALIALLVGCPDPVDRFASSEQPDDDDSAAAGDDDSAVEDSFGFLVNIEIPDLDDYYWPGYTVEVDGGLVYGNNNVLLYRDEQWHTLRVQAPGYAHPPIEVRPVGDLLQVRMAHAEGYLDRWPEAIVGVVEGVQQSFSQPEGEILLVHLNADLGRVEDADHQVLYWEQWDCEVDLAHYDDAVTTRNGERADSLFGGVPLDVRGHALRGEGAAGEPYSLALSEDRLTLVGHRGQADVQSGLTCQRQQMR